MNIPPVSFPTLDTDDGNQITTGNGMEKASRLEKEQSFHDQRYGGSDDERMDVRKHYSVNKHLIARYFEIVSGLCKDKVLLEYGCGRGSGSMQWLKQGARVTGIDISSEGIKQAIKRIEKTKYQADYYVMDAENTSFDDGSFDIIVGTGILHHLNLTQCYQELSRILKPDGHIVFVEPLGHNPFINLYRWLTPKMRTEHEHPLSQRDVKLLGQYFQKIDAEYYSLTTLLAVPFRNMRFFSRLHTILGKIDQVMFALPFIKRYAWMTIIHAYNPRK